MRGRRVALLLGAALSAGLTPALAAGAAQAAPLAADAPGRLDAYERQHPTWQRCAADAPAEFECATVQVPLDYRDPGGRRIEVAISRIKAADSHRRRGVLLLNPGGPGGPGLGLPWELDSSFPQSVKDRFDRIGFDPRGVGRSTPVDCGLTADEYNIFRPHRTFDANVAWARGVADKCRAHAGDLIPYVTTRNTARDMDVIRAVLGEKRISYLGLSYGTALGAVYTQMFPTRADRFVLDSSVGPDMMWRGQFRSWAPEAQAEFRRWTRWTAERSATYHLGDTPDEVAAGFRDLIARADRDPIVLGGTPVNGVQIRQTLRPMFATVAEAAKWVVVVKQGAAGEPTPELPQASPPDPSASLTVVCGDVDWPRDVQRYRADSARDSVRYPVFGDLASGIMPCAFWAGPREPVTVVDNRVPALIVQNEWDPATPLSGARSMHRSLKGSRMITVDEGEGHGVYLFAGNRCADETTTAYLVTGRLPGADVTCRAQADDRRVASPPSARLG
ncbi:alpha/beta hydrolase [Embleya scabrispora]|uniref:alpha/beta hydrolase n=1 Tax=Embleya scabrispora TaxID=159449 RepID=UPI001F39ED35|nr:alpha/beta hydrolase [Embleya scabrispora]